MRGRPLLRRRSVPLRCEGCQPAARDGLPVALPTDGATSRRRPVYRWGDVGEALTGAALRRRTPGTKAAVSTERGAA